LGDEGQPPNGGGGEKKQVCSHLHNAYIVCLRVKFRKRRSNLPTGGL
jgi:hypothetical protein